MEHLEDLKKLGFSYNEARVYLSLTKLGSSKAGNIAKYSELDRSSVYNALKSLLKKGLVSYVTIGKVKWFQCSDPKNVLTYLTNKLDLAKKIIPKLDQARKESKIKENVSLFKGQKGVKTVFEDILRHADENLIFGSEGQFSEVMPSFAKRFALRLENKGVKVRSIIRTKREKDSNSNVKTIPLKTESPVVTNIYKDKIAIVLWSETPEAILIENENAAKVWREYFEFMWKYASD